MPQLPAPQSPASQQLGPYLIQQELGKNREGGRITYLATHPDSGQPVVLKQFRFVQATQGWSGFKSHEREIAMLQAIAHPQVPRYLESFETEDGFCMVQEYKEAPSLAEKNHLTLPQMQQVARALLEILADLQQQAPPIIHRDIKPENILVGDELQVYLIDFGLARLNQGTVAASSIAAGTPGFMPPEEFFNRPLTTASDLYSVGATLISLLTQTSLANISDLLDDSYRFNFIEELPPMNPHFVDWLQKMVEPKPRDRFPDATTALAALAPLDITNLSSLATVKKSSDMSQPSLLRSPLSRKTFGLAVLGTLGSLTLFSTLYPKTAPVQQVATTTTRSVEQQWFEAVKPRCNTLEVITALQNNPYPPSPVGAGFGASCYALAGKLDLADQVIAALPPTQQKVAAMILFDIGHPVADRGDDESAGPIMDLVLKYWPENYMALYHAGMSAYVLADNDKAVEHLEAFLEIYSNNDGWRQKALLALENIEQGIPADNRFKVHH